MHEMALCHGLLDLVREEQRQRGFRSVRRVILEIGALGHVDPRALDFAFEVHAKDSPAEGATLEIREVMGRAWCLDCAQMVDLSQRGEPCPACAGYSLIVEQGEELKLKELEVV